jgi:anaphase-promoting complex subunit 1
LFYSWFKKVLCHPLPLYPVAMAVCDITGLNLSDLDTFPAGVRLPLLDCIRRCHEAPPTCWSAEAYKLIGRSDIIMTHSYADSVATPTVEVQDNVDGINLDLEV